MEIQRAKITKATLKKKNGEFMLLDYKTAYRAIVIVGQEYPKSQWNRIENPKIDLHV